MIAASREMSDEPFFTHNGGLHDGTSYSRSVCVEELKYNADGTIKKINISTESIYGK